MNKQKKKKKNPPPARQTLAIGPSADLFLLALRCSDTRASEVGVGINRGSRANMKSGLARLHQPAIISGYLGLGA